MATQTTRRALLGFAGLAGAIVAMPAVVVGAVRKTPSEFAQLHAMSAAARARFDALPEDLEYTNSALFQREEALMHEATDAFDRAVPTTIDELVAAMENAIGNGAYPGAETCERLIGYARDIAKKEGR